MVKLATLVAEECANDKSCDNSVAIIKETKPDDVTVSGVTYSPGEKHGDTACAALTGEDGRSCESRGGIYADYAGKTGTANTSLEVLTGLGACCADVAAG